MSNWCQFSCTVKGPPEILKQFKTRIDNSIVCRANDGELAVITSADKEVPCEFWLKNTSDAWAMEVLEFRGTSRNRPPLETLQLLSEEFPGIEFHINGTTEHEAYESWLVQAGHLLLTELMTGEICGETTCHMVNCVQLTPLPDWLFLNYPEQWLATLPNLDVTRRYPEPESPPGDGAI